MTRSVSDMVASASNSDGTIITSEVTDADNNTAVFETDDLNESTVIDDGEQLLEEVTAETEHEELPDDSFADDFKTPEHRKFFNSDGTEKSKQEIALMYVNLQKALGMPQDKKDEYLKHIGYTQDESLPEYSEATPEDDNNEIVYGQSSPDEDLRELSELATINLRELNETMGLNLKIFGGEEDFDEADPQIRKAWSISLEKARMTIDLIDKKAASQIAPYEEKQKLGIIQNTVSKVLNTNNIKDVTAEEVAADFKGVSFAEWKATSETARQGWILQTAKALAYDKLKANAIVSKQTQKNPAVLKTGNTALQTTGKTTLSANQQTEYNDVIAFLGDKATDSVKKIILENVRTKGR